PAYIGKSMFYGCTSLTSLIVPSSATYIGESAFYGCINLSSIELPSTITEIKGSAFHSCTSLTSINIPEGVTKLGNYALYNTGVKTIHIPSTVTSIGYQFAESSAVETITFAENSSLTFIDHRAFRDCDSLVGPVILPYGLIEMDYGVFDNCAKLKAVKMPDTLTTLSGNAALFNSCTSLEYVQFSKNLTGTIFKSMFENCTSLKAISLPDGVTKIDYKALRNCTSLEAVYLPSGLIELGSVNTGASDWGVFYQSPKVYLVNEPFNVFDGDKLVENFVMPQKPEVYYMPSGMTALGNSAFQNCSNLNKYIVFPTGITSVGECSQGAFFKASSSTNPVTFVFLGDMTSIRIRQNDNASSNMSFVFANPNDTGITSMNFIIGSANNAYMTNTYAYFCKSNTVYDLSTFKATNATVYTVTEDDYTKTVNTEEAQPHFHSPRLDKTSDATCTLPAGEFTYCFCGTLMTSDIVDGSEPLGHDSEGADISKYYPTIEVNGDVVTNYFANIIHSFVCQREDCQQTIVESQEGTALFTKKGFTAPENSEQPAICHAITVNTDAILEYNKILGAGNEIKYGVVVGKATASGTPVNAQGKSSGDAIVVGFEGTNYSFIQAKITNVPAETGLYCSAYVVDAGVVTYLYEGSVTSTAQVISISAENATLPEATVPSNDEE
ncbi:MAG: leucine-rich repeat domain-containing protein, partial [Clostridia bacterium]|nr:leucine-rich repeat domain-containing protein [Clostridia bacterium]